MIPTKIRNGRNLKVLIMAVGLWIFGTSPIPGQAQPIDLPAGSAITVVMGRGTSLRPGTKLSGKLLGYDEEGIGFRTRRNQKYWIKWSHIRSINGVRLSGYTVRRKRVAQPQEVPQAPELPYVPEQKISPASPNVSVSGADLVEGVAMVEPGTADRIYQQGANDSGRRATESRKEDFEGSEDDFWTFGLGGGWYSAQFRPFAPLGSSGFTNADSSSGLALGNMETLYQLTPVWWGGLRASAAIGSMQYTCTNCIAPRNSMEANLISTAMQVVLKRYWQATRESGEGSARIYGIGGLGVNFIELGYSGTLNTGSAVFFGIKQKETLAAFLVGLGLEWEVSDNFLLAPEFGYQSWGKLGDMDTGTILLDLNGVHIGINLVWRFR